MPQPRKYADRAQQQAAYRRRCAAALLAHNQVKGLPALPAIPAMPGTARWRAAARMAHDLLTTICDEMNAYADDRTEQWQQSERADEFTERLAAVQEIRDTLDAYR
jgi:hypothetical protein